MKEYFKKILIVFLLIIVIFGVLTIYFLITNIATNKNSQNFKIASVSIDNHNFSAYIADTLLSQSKGLAAFDSITDNQGMLFLFPEKEVTGFWMKDMKFPIDLIWISGDTIVGFEKDMVPQPGEPDYDLKVYYPPEPIDKVLEINAGLIDKYNFQIGDLVDIKTIN
jgi:uncharacterized membrane protein (UPF0127 family)